MPTKYDLMPTVSITERIRDSGRKDCREKGGGVVLRRGFVRKGLIRWVWPLAV